jgi:hypothetical protein
MEQQNNCLDPLVQEAAWHGQDWPIHRLFMAFMGTYGDLWHY